jgi:peptidoglycan/LPS O-acetylase OafA/YrhL
MNVKIAILRLFIEFLGILLMVVGFSSVTEGPGNLLVVVLPVLGYAFLVIGSLLYWFEQGLGWPYWLFAFVPFFGALVLALIKRRRKREKDPVRKAKIRELERLLRRPIRERDV